MFYTKWNFLFLSVMVILCQINWFVIYLDICSIIVVIFLRVFWTCLIFAYSPLKFSGTRGWKQCKIWKNGTGAVKSCYWNVTSTGNSPIFIHKTCPCPFHIHTKGAHKATGMSEQLMAAGQRRVTFFRSVTAHRFPMPPWIPTHLFPQRQN